MATQTKEELINDYKKTINKTQQYAFDSVIANNPDIAKDNISVRNYIDKFKALPNIQKAFVVDYGRLPNAKEAVALENVKSELQAGNKYDTNHFFMGEGLKNGLLMASATKSGLIESKIWSAIPPSTQQEMAMPEGKEKESLLFNKISKAITTLNPGFKLDTFNKASSTIENELGRTIDENTQAWKTKAKSEADLLNLTPDQKNQVYAAIDSAKFPTDKMPGDTDKALTIVDQSSRGSGSQAGNGGVTQQPTIDMGNSGGVISGINDSRKSSFATIYKELTGVDAPQDIIDYGLSKELDPFTFRSMVMTTPEYAKAIDDKRKLETDAANKKTKDDKEAEITGRIPEWQTTYKELVGTDAPQDIIDFAKEQDMSSFEFRNLVKNTDEYLKTEQNRITAEQEAKATEQVGFREDARASFLAEWTPKLQERATEREAKSQEVLGPAGEMANLARTQFTKGLEEEQGRAIQSMAQTVGKYQPYGGSALPVNVSNILQEGVKQRGGLENSLSMALLSLQDQERLRNDALKQSEQSVLDNVSLSGLEQENLLNASQGQDLLSRIYNAEIGRLAESSNTYRTNAANKFQEDLLNAQFTYGQNNMGLSNYYDTAKSQLNRSYNLLDQNYQTNLLQSQFGQDISKMNLSNQFNIDNIFTQRSWELQDQAKQQAFMANYLEELRRGSDNGAAMAGFFQGAASGASAGSAAGPWGALYGGVAGGILGAGANS